MASTMIRVEEGTYAALRERAEARNISMGTVIAELLEADREARFWAAVEADYAALRSDPQAWAEEQEFRRELEGTLADGLGDDVDS